MNVSPRVKELVFPDSGKKVYLPVVSVASFALKIQRKYPRPNPPVQVVDYGDGVKRSEFNYSHPDYRQKLVDWEKFIEAKATETAMRRLTEFNLTPEQKKEVDEWKSGHLDEWDEHDSDHDLYLENIAIETNEDFQALMRFMSGADPTAQGVQSNQDGFRS